MKVFQNESTRVQKLLELYQKLLTVLLLEADDNGIICADIRLYGELKPLEVMVEGTPKKLGLPTKANLANKDLIIFHPLNEGVGAESVVHAMIRRQLGDRINLGLKFAIMSLLEKLNSIPFQQHMTADQQAFFQLIAKSNDKDIAQFDTWAKDNPRPQFSSFIELIVRSRKGAGKNELNGETYPKICVIEPNILKDLEDLPKQKMAARAKQCVTSMVEAILPEVRNGNPYAFGSKSTTAPHTLALLETAYKLTQELIRFEELFPGSIDISMHHPEDQYGAVLLGGFTPEVMEELRTIDTVTTNGIIRALPQQRYNKPEHKKEEEKTVEVHQPTRQVAMSPQVNTVLPVTQQQVIPQAQQNKIVTLEDLLAGNVQPQLNTSPNTQQFQTPMMTQFPQQQVMPMMAPPMQYQQPQFLVAPQGPPSFQTTQPLAQQGQFFPQQQVMPMMAPPMQYQQPSYQSFGQPASLGVNMPSQLTNILF